MIALGIDDDELLGSDSISEGSPSTDSAQEARNKVAAALGEDLNVQQQEQEDTEWTKKIPSTKEEMYMLGAGVNKANVSGIKLKQDDISIDGLGEGLGVAGDKNEEYKEPDYFEAL